MTVEEYIDKHHQYSDILKKLRNLILKCNLQENIKWGAPVYSYNGKNIVGIGAFKSYAGLWFFQGALLKDKNSVLVNAQEGKTSALRQWRFTEFKELQDSSIVEYIKEAIANQKAGKEIKPKKKPLVIPELLNEAMASDSELAEAFEGLSLSCKREYAEYISEAKKEETKLNRLKKIKPMILSKKGLNDKYRN